MASTVIGAGITIEGEITTDEDVVVRAPSAASYGERGGHDRAGRDRRGRRRRRTARVAGAVTGNITSSDRVDFQAGAQVVGNVKAARITIADGAQFKGNVDMDV